MAETFDQYAHQYLNDPDSELFNSALVTRFSEEAETDFADDFPCLQTRVALSVVSGTATYTLNEDVRSIRRITWKGKKLDPLPHNQFRDAFQAGTQQGTPFWYLYNNIGLNQIKFFPSPNETIGSTTDDLYGSEIDSRVIVDYFRMPDFSTYVLPLYFRRRLLKAYVMRGCFGVEGPGQNVKNVKYFKARYQFLKLLYGGLLEDIHNRPRKLVLGMTAGQSFFPGSPVLPMSRFGTSVDAGE